MKKMNLHCVFAMCALSTLNLIAQDQADPTPDPKKVIATRNQQHQNSQSLRKYLTKISSQYMTLHWIITGNSTQTDTFNKTAETVFIDQKIILAYIEAYENLKTGKNTVDLTEFYIKTKRNYAHEQFDSLVEQEASTKSYRKTTGELVGHWNKQAQYQASAPKVTDSDTTRAIKEQSEMEARRIREKREKEFNKITKAERNDATAEIDMLVNNNLPFQQTMATNLVRTTDTHTNTVQNWQDNKTRNMIISAAVALAGLCTAGYTGKTGEFGGYVTTVCGGVTSLVSVIYLLVEASYTQSWYEAKKIQLTTIKKTLEDKLAAIRKNLEQTPKE